MSMERNIYSLQTRHKNEILCRKIAFGVLLCLIVFTLPSLCRSHKHENPSFKYSKEANENFQSVQHNHQHDHKHHHHHHEEEFLEESRLHHHNDDHNSHLHIQHSSHKEAFVQDLSSVWMYSLGSTALISAAPFFLLFFIPLDSSEKAKPRLKVLLAFAAGGLLGDAFLHLIPHAVHGQHSHHHNDHHEHSHGHDNGHNHQGDIAIGLWVLGGIVAFLAVEKIVRLLKDGDSHHHHHHYKNSTQINSSAVTKTNVNNHNGSKKVNKSQSNVANSTTKKANLQQVANTKKVEISGYLNLAADFAHNFTDGLAIGASYLAGNSIGLVTTVTILLHEVPHEIGDFAILIKSGCSRRQAILLQLVTALGALAGNALALVGVGMGSDSVPWVLPFTAGGFIYIATVSVLPELLEESTKLLQSVKEIAALLAGVSLMVFIANFE